ncbi:helicase-associated domain-containing protein [Crystallibacter degradans]|uniref:helicase-associated domain-containing protein n=1 Tax=Crystallibacter degradans TaxID=2726743 RepID=UPI0014740656|nr:helicase-associated domain-containing protein [Arthrobacter sp. SF27]NMR31473.1 helicase-associated domain-containing protein [Arthrobacter sp. SF27]
MSSIRALADDLAARSDSQLRALLSARPDLCLPPVPDFSALAARACTRISLQRALEKLSRPELDLLETIVLTTDIDAGTGIDAEALQPLLVAAPDNLVQQPGNTTVQELDAYLAKLHTLGLLVPVPAGADRQAGFLPVASLPDVLGPYPAGLGRTYAKLAAASAEAGERMVAVVVALRAAGYPLAGADGLAELPPADKASVAARALESWLSASGTWESLLDEAPAKTGELLERFRRSPVGTVPQALRNLEVHDAGASPVEWMLARGLLVPVDASHVELPRAAGIAARGGAVINPWATSAPGFAGADGEAAGSAGSPRSATGTARTVRASLRDNAAYSAVAETLRLVSELLVLTDATPVATLRAGGVGVREIKRLADELRVDTGEVSWLLELAAAAGLLTLDVDTSKWKTNDAGAYAGFARHHQWLLLATAWLALDRAPALVGSPAQPGSRPDAAKSGINALAAEASRPDAPAVRRRLLDALAELSLPVGDGTSMAVPAESLVTDYLCWHQPRLRRRFERLVPGMLVEAARLGLLGSGALTELGVALAAGEPEEAAELLDRQLPEPLSHFLLQADLTAVAPGYLEPAVNRELALLSTAEGQGPAAIYRFSADSVRRALDAGQDAEGILEFLTRHSATEVPQPLRYLVEDTAARHGAVRVGTMSSYLRGDDPELLDALLADPRAALLGLRRLAPTVLASKSSARELLHTLRGLGYSPAPDKDDDGVALAAAGGAGGVEDAAGSTSDSGGVGRVAGSAPSSFPVRTNPWVLTDEDLQAQLDRLRGAGTPAKSAAGAEAEPLLALETLRKAIRLKRPVRIGIVEPNGAHRHEVLQPLSVGGGRLRVFDAERDSERVVSIHRVMDIELVDEAGGKKRSTTDG